MSAIRILHIVGAMNRGSAETLIMELYRHIDRTKVQLLALSREIFAAKKDFIVDQLHIVEN